MKIKTLKKFELSWSPLLHRYRVNVKPELHPGHYFISLRECFAWLQEIGAVEMVAED